MNLVLKYNKNTLFVLDCGKGSYSIRKGALTVLGGFFPYAFLYSKFKGDGVLV